MQLFAVDNDAVKSISVAFASLFQLEKIDTNWPSYLTFTVHAVSAIKLHENQ